jgi:hypothetical protein
MEQMTEEFCLLRYNAVWCGEIQPGIQMKISPSSVFKNKPRKKPCLLHADFLFILLFNPEAKSDIFFRNVDLFTELHGLIFQKIELFTATTVRTSNFTLCTKG